MSRSELLHQRHKVVSSTGRGQGVVPRMRSQSTSLSGRCPDLRYYGIGGAKVSGTLYTISYSHYAKIPIKMETAIAMIAITLLVCAYRLASFAI